MIEEPDAPSGLAPIAAIVVALVAIFVSVVVVWILVGREPYGGGERLQVEHTNVPPSAAFSTFMPKEQKRAEQRASLDRWQWLDPAHTRVRMPIEAAMEARLR